MRTSTARVKATSRTIRMLCDRLDELVAIEECLEVNLPTFTPEQLARPDACCKLQELREVLDRQLDEVTDSIQLAAGQI